MAKYNGPMNDPNWRKMIAARKEPAKKSPSVADGIFKTAHTLAKGLGGPGGVKRTTAGRASGSRGGDAVSQAAKRMAITGSPMHNVGGKILSKSDQEVHDRKVAEHDKNKFAVQRLKNERDAAANRVISQKEDSASRTFAKVDALKKEAELNRTIATTKSQAELVRAQDDLKALKGLPPSKNNARVMGKIEAEARAVDAKMSQANAEHAAKMDEAGVNHSSTKDKSIRESFERNRAELRQGLEDNGETAKKREVDEMALSEAAHEHGISEQAAHEAIRREQRKGSAAPAEAAKAQIAEKVGREPTIVEKRIMELRQQSVDAFKNAKTEDEARAVLRKRNTLDKAHESLFGTNANKISKQISEGKISWQDQPRVPAGNEDGGQWTKG